MPRASRSQTVVCSAVPQETATRRASLALLAGLLFGAGAVGSAQANLGVSKNSSVGSMSAYDLEGGIKKQGIKAGRKKKLLAKVKKEAIANAAK